MTAGQDFTATLRKAEHIGPRSRWFSRSRARFGMTLTRDYLLTEVYSTLNFPGSRSDAITDGFRLGRTALNAWDKHIEGYRIDPVLISKLHQLTPWQWTAFLGDMVDSGCTNMGEFEDWFNRMAREQVAA